jgi:hypothetical protein
MHDYVKEAGMPTSQIRKTNFLIELLPIMVLI